MFLRRRHLLGLLASLGLSAERVRAAKQDGEQEAEPPGQIRLGLALHLARAQGQPVADEAFLERQLTTANRIFAPYGLKFELQERHRRGQREAMMQTRADRDALGAFTRPRWINVFVVASLRDVDEPTRVRRGVHWRSSSHPGTHFIILSAISFDAVLAHELGHFLGNPAHSETPGNLMSYQHTEVLPFLDAAQQQRLRTQVERYLRSGELARLRHATAPATRVK